MVIGPKGTPYEDGVFELSITLPKDFPYRPPIFKFVTKIYHINVGEDGEIGL